MNLIKSIFVAGLASWSICSCNAGVEDKKVKDFEAKTETIVSDYTAKRTEIAQSTVLSDEAKEYSLDSLYDATVETLTNYCLDIVKHNRNNELGAVAFKTIYSELSADELAALYDTLGPKAREDEDIQKIKVSIDAMASTKVGAMFTDFEVDGVKFSDYIGKGKWVLVDFWASWCGPCKGEIPNIASVYKKYAGKDFDVLSVAVWDKPEDTRRAAAEEGVVWNQMINTQKVATDIYGIQGIPQIMLFAPDGTIARRDLRGEGIEAAVREALGL